MTNRSGAVNMPDMTLCKNLKINTQLPLEGLGGVKPPKLRKWQLDETGKRVADPEKIKQLFWLNVKKGAENECWEWIGRKNRQFYGVFYSFKLFQSKLAHRASLQMHLGKEITEFECVCHRCDNPSCVNPSHLFFGTRGDNNRDSRIKGRNCRGNRHPFAILKEEDIPKIRALFGIKNAPEIGKIFGVSTSTIQMIKTGGNWKHIK